MVSISERILDMAISGQYDDRKLVAVYLTMLRVSTRSPHNASDIKQCAQIIHMLATDGENNCNIYVMSRISNHHLVSFTLFPLFALVLR